MQSLPSPRSSESGTTRPSRSVQRARKISATSASRSAPSPMVSLDRRQAAESLVVEQSDCHEPWNRSNEQRDLRPLHHTVLLRRNLCISVGLPRHIEHEGLANPLAEAVHIARLVSVDRGPKID